jgi:DNA-binding protein H-NS
VAQIGFGVKHLGWHIGTVDRAGAAVVEVPFAVARSVGHIRAASSYGCEIYGKPPSLSKLSRRHQKICIDVLISSLPLNSIHVPGNGNLAKGEPIQMAAKDLDRMSLRELQEFELKVQKARASAQERNRADLRKKIETMVADAGFKLSDIFSGRGGKGRTVAAKYANPDDPSETWTGRGRKPRWLTAKIGEGAKIEKFLIK